VSRIQRSGTTIALSRTRFDGLLIVSSFSPPALAGAREAMRRVRLGYLASRTAAGLEALHRKIGLFSFHPHHRLATRRRIRAAQRLGLAVFVWPVNDARLLRALVARDDIDLVSIVTFFIELQTTVIRCTRPYPLAQKRRVKNNIFVSVQRIQRVHRHAAGEE